MPHTLDQLLPSLQSMGVWTYWILALFAMFEAIILTGILVPGAIAAAAGGILAQRGVIDFFDLAWFIAAGTFLGSEVSFRIGRLASKSISGSSTFAKSRHGQKAADLLQRYGGFAMVVGRFFGPLSAFVPFSAGMAAMPYRRFAIWNAGSALAYALVLPAIGYLFGGALGTLGAAAPRVLAFGIAATGVLAILWFMWSRTRRAVPVLAVIAMSALNGFTSKPFVRSAMDRHPGMARFIAARFGTEQFLGLTATVLGILFVYVVGAYADSVYDFVGSSAVVSSDTRIANLLYALRDDRLIAFFGWITEVGGSHSVITMLVGASAGLLVLRRFDLLGGLWIAAVGNQITVTLLKSFFARPRSGLGYFVETSGSFPSGHAAGAIAVWTMLFYLAWRVRLLSAGTAGLCAITLAFLIGLSRVYLIEHYLSDVLNGYLVGALWLILGIAFCEWRRRSTRSNATPAQRRIALVSIALTVCAAIFLASTTVSPLNTVAARTSRTITDPARVLAQAKVPDKTETLVGDQRQSVNLIVVAPDDAALSLALQTAGWRNAPRPGLGLLGRAFLDDWLDRPLPDALVIPTFWDNRPSTIGFERSLGDLSDDQRLHVRFWDSRFRTDTGAAIYVGTLTQEAPLDWAVQDRGTPYAGPRVNAALATLADDLTGAGLGAILP